MDPAQMSPQTTKPLKENIARRLWLILLIPMLGLTLLFLMRSFRQQEESWNPDLWSRPAPPVLEDPSNKPFKTQLWFTPPPDAEAPSLSPDGTKLTYMTRLREDETFGYEVDSIWQAQNNKTGSWEPSVLATGVEPGFGETRTYFNPTFDAKGDRILSGYAFFWNALSLPILPTLKTGVSLIDKNGELSPEQFINPADLNLMGEVLQHPKISPNGQWVAFYCRKRLESRGIYLFHLTTHKLIHLSNQDDKHPTWTPDGRYLLFHHQVGGDALDPVPNPQPEESYLGYFDLKFTHQDAVKATRILMDPIQSKPYTYFKHPTVVPNTHLLFFHARLTPSGPHQLMVRDFSPNSPIYHVSLLAGVSKDSTEIKPLKEVKHPASAVTQQVLVFLGKVAHQHRYSFYQLPEESIHRIEILIQEKMALAQQKESSPVSRVAKSITGKTL
ncbi:MAG: hypothetical protein K2X66_11055 [Cyanobacteria bacterium]|nr:hypothetical protein [Cyanobacteriota bacterium]